MYSHSEFIKAYPSYAQLVQELMEQYNECLDQGNHDSNAIACLFESDGQFNLYIPNEEPIEAKSEEAIIQIFQACHNSCRYPIHKFSNFEFEDVIKSEDSIYLKFYCDVISIQELKHCEPYSSQYLYLGKYSILVKLHHECDETDAIGVRYFAFKDLTINVQYKCNLVEDLAITQWLKGQGASDDNEISKPTGIFTRNIQSIQSNDLYS